MVSTQQEYHEKLIAANFLSREHFRALLCFERLRSGVSTWQDRKYAYDPGMTFDVFIAKNGIELGGQNG